MQKAAEAETATVEKEGVRVILNGKLEALEVRINPALDLARQETLIKECFNDAAREVQTALAKKLSGMLG